MSDFLATYGFPAMLVMGAVICIYEIIKHWNDAHDGVADDDFR